MQAKNLHFDHRQVKGQGKVRETLTKLACSTYTIEGPESYSRLVLILNSPNWFPVGSLQYEFCPAREIAPARQLLMGTCTAHTASTLLAHSHRATDDDDHRSRIVWFAGEGRQAGRIAPDWGRGGGAATENAHVPRGLTLDAESSAPVRTLHTFLAVSSYSPTIFLLNPEPKTPPRPTCLEGYKPSELGGWQDEHPREDETPRDGDPPRDTTLVLPLPTLLQSTQ